MDIHGYEEKLRKDGLHECTCFINPPCNFCTDTVRELYEEWCEDNNVVPEY